MAILGSVPVSGFVAPTAETDIYPSHDSKYGKGGWREVATLLDRDAITVERRAEGMAVYVQETDTVYILKDGIDNTNWTLLQTGGGTSTISGATDVVLTALADGEVLKWDAATGKWVNGTAGGSGAGVGTSELPAYSTSEVLTAERWINGKPVYRKVVSMGALPNAAAKSIAHGISNLDALLDLSGVAFHVNGDARIPLPYVSTSTSTIQMHMSKTNVIVTDRIDLSVAYDKSYAIIYYTKTTDTALSPVALIGGGGGGGSTENITTNVEYLVPKTIDGKQVYGRRIDCGYLPNATSMSIAIPDYNSAYSYWVSPSDSKAYNSSNQHSITLPTARTDIYYVNVDVLGSNIRAITGGDNSEYYAYITLHYTK